MWGAVVSDHYLSVIPADPKFVPDAVSRSEALRLFTEMVGRADEIKLKLTEHIQFIDQGENAECVLCPYCGDNLGEWWYGAMDRAWASRFENLAAAVPCCGREASLNDLRYEWPAGFARFVLRARNAAIGGYIQADQASELERALGCTIRQVLTMY